jgi:hypothetical protein
MLTIIRDQATDDKGHGMFKTNQPLGTESPGNRRSPGTAVIGSDNDSKGAVFLMSATVKRTAEKGIVKSLTARATNRQKSKTSHNMHVVMKLLSTRPMVRMLHFVLALSILGVATDGLGQVLTNTSDSTLSVTLPFGTLTPGTSNTPSSTTVQFRLRASHTTGYNVKVTSATFTPTPTASVDGGTTISASDVGVGIVSVYTPPPFAGVTPRNDVITGGFDYDPATTTGTNGLTPYGGLSGSPARATVQDLVSTPNIKILSGNRIHNSSEHTNGANSNKNYLEVTLRFGLLRQYFTPATFTGTITLQISYGP